MVRAAIPTFELGTIRASQTRGFVEVRSRASARARCACSIAKPTWRKACLADLLVIGVIVFFIVEIISFMIGVTMTRTITGAVHRLYEGTQKVIEGDFSHRIEVQGRDQLRRTEQSL